jgi:peptidoglycan/LPS O-acetylase OafA/YrhL
VLPKDYRPDIDSLRAIAVISVLFCHVGFNTFSGGFLGVDIFFVISGFLITRLIRDEVLKTRSFSFSHFYIRRVRRLFPALYFTLCLSFLFSTVIFPEQEFRIFCGALIHAILGISNFYFWKESGYFDAEALVRPLLHTWSLGVEEQFYLVWPFLLVFLLLRAPNLAPLVFLVFAFVISLIANVIFGDGFSYFIFLGDMFFNGPSTVFYLMPFRIFEFSIGALLVWLIQLQTKNIFILKLFVWFGLTMIIYPIITYTEETFNLFYISLLPCLGTALIIYAGTAQPISKLLDNIVTVRIGLISYSLYLIHWPIIVFYRYWKFENLSTRDQVAICVLSIVLAVLMHKFIEQPFRFRVSSLRAWPNKVFYLSCLVLVLALIVPSASIWAKRVSFSEIGNTGEGENFDSFLKNYKVEDQLSVEAKVFNAHSGRNAYKLQTSFSEVENKKLLVIGDSMGEDVINVLLKSDYSSIYEFRYLSESCGFELQIAPNKNCRPLEDVIHSKIYQKADVIIFASYWHGTVITNFAKTINYVKKESPNKKVVLVGQKQQTFHGTRLFHRQYQIFEKKLQKRSQPVFVQSNEINNKLKKYSNGYYVLDFNESICGIEECIFVDENDYIIINDRTHLSPKGAEYMAKWLDNQKKLKDYLLDHE